MLELGSPQWKEVEKDAIQWPVCNQDDKIVQKVCDVVLLRHPEGFLVGGKQQPGTSSHPHPSRLLAPDPLIRVSVITPPALPGPPPLCPLPKTEIALSTQDSNSQHRGTTHKKPNPKSFRSLGHKAAPVSLYVPAFGKMSIGAFFVGVALSRTLGWLGSSRRAGATCAPRPPSVFHKPACATHVRQPTLRQPATQQVRREVTLRLLAADGEMRPALTF